MVNNGINIIIPFGEKIDLRFKIKPEPYTFQKAERLVVQLVNDIKSCARRYRGVAFSTIFFGGCGPSLLTLDQLYRILQALYDSLTITPLEQTMLIIPRTVHADKAKILRESGFDQITIRINGSSIPNEDFMILRNAGFNSVGFEYQPPPNEQLSENLLHQLSSLSPDHIYILPPNTVTRSKLIQQGFHEFLPGHFCLPGKENRHLQNLYTQHSKLILSFGIDKKQEPWDLSFNRL